MKNFIYRSLFFVTLIFGCLFISTNPYEGFGYWITFGLIFFLLFGVSFVVFGNLPEKKINELMFINEINK